jgi:hypothetical protein
MIPSGDKLCGFGFGSRRKVADRGFVILVILVDVGRFRVHAVLLRLGRDAAD